MAGSAKEVANPAKARGDWKCRSRACQHLSLHGKKSIHHHRSTLLFSFCRSTPRSESKKKAMVYTIFLGKQGKRVYTIGPERRIYTIEAQSQKKKKRRVSTVVVYTFFFPATVQSETWLFSRESSRTTSEPPNSYEFSSSRPCFKGESLESSCEPGGSDVVRELSREQAIFQIGL